MRKVTEMKMRSKVLLSVLSAGVVSSPALAVDPTYTTPLGTMLGGIDITAITTDVTTFAGALFALILVILGIGLGKKLLAKGF